MSNQKQDYGKICATCEYFDGGGESHVQKAIKSGVPLHGDCLSGRSPRFQTYSNETCPVWTATATEDETFATSGRKPSLDDYDRGRG